jgi:hypothetical protein
MAAAANLVQAAQDSANNLQVKWLANTLKPALLGFWTDAINTFPEQIVDNHPVSNWLAVISSISERMPASGVSFDQLIDSVQAVYRVCWMTNQLRNQGLISTAQAQVGPSSILGSYNTNF